MQDARSQRWLGVGGLVFVALIVLTGVLYSPVTTHASAAKVIASVHQHKGALTVSAFAIGLAVFEGLFFFWYLRDYLCDVATNRRLATIAYAGAILFGASGALNAGMRLSMADAVGHVDPVVMQTLNVLQNDVNTFMGGAGIAVLLVATGVALIRNGPLPGWLGWIAIVLAILAVFVGAPAVGLWLLIASIVILVRASRSSGNTVPV
jgi:hypothetical protein